MSKSWMNSVRLLIGFGLFVGFSFLIIEQRLESKTYEIRIKNIQTSIADINMKKREILIQIESETERLSSYNYQNVGQPISMKDIIIVPLKDPIQTKPDLFENNFDRLVARLMRVTSGFPEVSQ